MAKLTKIQRARVEAALRNAERALRFIADDSIAVCRVENRATTTLHYTRPSDNTTLYTINKDAGSDLVGIRNTVDELREMIEADKATTQK